MAGVNKVILVGNLGKDPEVRTLDNGTKVARFSLATTESYKDRNSGERIDQTEWHNIVLWRGLAEIAERFLRKGSQIYVEGKLQTRSYEDKEGVTKYNTDVVGLNMTMLGGKSDGGGGSNQNSYNEPSSVKETSSSGSAAPSSTSSDDIDDLPF